MGIFDYHHDGDNTYTAISDLLVYISRINWCNISCSNYSTMQISNECLYGSICQGHTTCRKITTALHAIFVFWLLQLYLKELSRLILASCFIAPKTFNE